MPIIGFVAAQLLKLGLPQRAATLAAWGAAIVGVVLIGWGAWSLWLSHHDAKVVGADRDRGNAVVLNSQIAADRGASAEKAARDADEANTTQALQEEVHDARRNRTSALDALSNSVR